MMALTMSMTSCTDDNANGGDPGMEIKPIPQALSRVQQTDFAQQRVCQQVVCRAVCPIQLAGTECVSGSDKHAADLLYTRQWS